MASGNCSGLYLYNYITLPIECLWPEPYSWIYTVPASYTCAWSQDRGSRMSLMDFCLGTGTGFASRLVLVSVCPMSAELFFLAGRSLRGAATGFWRWCVGSNSLGSSIRSTPVGRCLWWQSRNGHREESVVPNRRTGSWWKKKKEASPTPSYGSAALLHKNPG